MDASGGQDIDREVQEIKREVPHGISRILDWATRPAVRWMRIPVAILLIVCGILGFLRILGFWMVPLGVLLLAIYIPSLRGPTVKLLRWVRA